MAEEDLVITTEDGKVQGKTSEDYVGGTFYSFLGIPYAKSPIGDLRFKSPIPVEPWEGIRDCTAEGPECPSNHMLFGNFVGSEENCLNVNVYTKQVPQHDTPLKPVMVWIHGGAFLHGSNKTELFGPDYLITEDIVLVAINYRLGVLGFLSLEDSSLGVPGNNGLKDQVLALKWVQRNIQKFNGDPNNVTIFGESAGSASVHYLYLSPLAKGLFHKAIMQSGCALNCWALGCHNGKAIAKLLNFEETDEKKILEYLKKVPVHKIVKAQHKHPDLMTANAIRPFGPVVEKSSSEEAFLTEDAVEILKKGTFNKVPIIMGYNSKEGIFFEIVQKLYPSARNTTNFETEIHHALKLKSGSDKSQEIATKIEKFYFGDTKPSQNVDKLYLLKSDNQFIHAIHQSLSLQKNSCESPIYLYRMSIETSLNQFKTICTSKLIPVLFLFYYFTYKSGEGFAKNLWLKMSRSLPKGSPTGVCHADDLGYFFKSFLSHKIEPGSVEDIAIKRFVKLWTNFAKYGNPTPDTDDELLGKVSWKPVSRDENHYLDIGKELKTAVNPDRDRMHFWDTIYDSC